MWHADGLSTEKTIGIVLDQLKVRNSDRCAALLAHKQDSCLASMVSGQGSTVGEVSFLMALILS